MPKYDIMKSKYNDYYFGEPVYYSKEWYSSRGGSGDIVTSDSEAYIKKLKPKTIYIPQWKKPAYVRYQSPRYVRREPVKCIHASNPLYPIVRECKSRSAKHLKPIEVVTRCPYVKHHSATYIEDSTSFDEKSISQYSNYSVDVSCDMSAINRDVEAILQQYERVLDDTIHSEYEKRTSTGKDDEQSIQKFHRIENANNNRKKNPEKLTSEQIKILSMEKPPLEKLKDIPVQYLKPRLPPYLKERKIQLSENKKSNETEKSEVNTDQLLKELLQDLAAKGLTKSCKEDEIIQNSNLENVKQTKFQNSNQITVSTQTIDNKVDVTVNTFQIPTEKVKPKYATTYPDLTNLEEFVDNSVKFDMNICGNNEQNVINYKHSCEHCRQTSNSTKIINNGSCDSLKLPIDTINNEKLKDNDKKQNSTVKKTTDGVPQQKEQVISTTLRECLSDLTHSRNQDKIDYTNKSNPNKSYNWQFDDLNLKDKKGRNIFKNNLQNEDSTTFSGTSDKRVSVSRHSLATFSIDSNGTQPFSIKSDTLVTENDELGILNQTIKSNSQQLPQSKSIFNLPSLSLKSQPDTESTNRDNSMLSCQPMAGGDAVDNDKKILDFMEDCFTIKTNNSSDSNPKDLINEKLAQLDSTVCVEIMRRLTETLMKNQPSSLTIPNVHKSVHLNILKQLRIDHLRHIQQEIKHIEDLDEFLLNFGLNTQLMYEKDKNYILESNLGN